MIWVVSLFVVAIGLGLLVRSDDIGLGILGAGLVGLLGGAVVKRVWVAAVLAGPLSFVYALTYAFSVASRAGEGWDGYDTGYLAGFMWFPGGLLAMFFGAIVSGLMGAAVRAPDYGPAGGDASSARQEPAQRASGLEP